MRIIRNYVVFICAKITSHGVCVRDLSSLLSTSNWEFTRHYPPRPRAHIARGRCRSVCTNTWWTRLFPYCRRRTKSARGQCRRSHRECLHRRHRSRSSEECRSNASNVSARTSVQSFVRAARAVERAPPTHGRSLFPSSPHTIGIGAAFIVELKVKLDFAPGTVLALGARAW
jgi:hypothetical protein